MEAKQCSKCKETKPVSEFNRCNRPGRSPYQSYCKSCSNAASRKSNKDNPGQASARVKKHKEKAMAWLNEIKMEAGCARCGYNEHPAALEFDHIDRFQKSFTIGAYPGGVSRKRLEEEVAKCQVLCSNCHRIKTYENKDMRPVSP